MICPSNLAIEKLFEFSMLPENKGKHLRIYCSGKGCDGFIYGVCFDTHVEPGDYVQKLHHQTHSLDLRIDNQTLNFVQDSSLEWETNEQGSGFVIHNPRHNRYRGKFYLRKFWQDKLKEYKESAL
jgi:iron-sulfur cluster insertion protein